MGETQKSYTGMTGMILIVIGIVAIGLLAMGLKDTTINLTEQSMEGTLSVQGSVQMTVAPDRVSTTFGMTALGATPLEAQNEVNAVINAIIEALEENGVSLDDVETSTLTLYEEKWYNEREPVSLGWRATQALTVTSADVETVGSLIDIAVANGANTVQGVTFLLSDEARATYMEEALGKAGEAARDKADAIAEGLGVAVGKVKSVSDATYYYVPYDAKSMTDAESRPGDQTIVLPGDLTITASINVVYYLK
jgi:uncharacterized protein YggE